MNPPLSLGMNIDQNADFNLMIEISTCSGSTDITGYEFIGQMRATTDPSSPVVGTFVFTIQDQINNTGQVLLSFLAASVETVTTSVATPLNQLRQTTPFVYDVFMQDTLGTKTRIMEGIAYVSPAATIEAFP